MSDAQSLKTLGNALRAAGDLEGAAGNYRHSLEIEPDYVPSLYNLGLVLRELGRPAEAEPYFRRATELDPRDAEALLHLAMLLDESGRIEEGAHAYRKVLELVPRNPLPWLRLGKCCEQLGQADEAMRSYRQALDLDPALTEARNALGILLMNHGRLDEAAAHYRRFVELEPAQAVPYNNLGCALLMQKRIDEAIGCFRKAIELLPDYADAYINLGNLYVGRGEHDEAKRCYAEGHQACPDNAALTDRLLYTMQQLCDWSRFDELCARRRRDLADAPGQRTSAFSLLSIPSTPAEQLACARHVAAGLQDAAAAERARLAFRFRREPKTRLKVGYLSGDFREHVIAYVMTEVFELHDRERIEAVGYSYGPDDRGPARARLERALDRFVDIRPLSDAAAAKAIHADGVDILVDLNGYTADARSGIAALRPAPIQVSYLGFPATMGAEFIDYLVADPFVLRPQDAAYYTEQPAYMPDSYYIGDRTRQVADTPPREELGLPRNAFVFCCFNQTFKILPGMFAAWMRLLAAVPESVLWLAESNRWANDNLKREAAHHAIDPGRIVLAPRVTPERNLSRLRAADLVLDTLPYNAHTTANDALWVGVPVLTSPGDTFASRVAGSQLMALGLPELVSESLAGYEAMALRLARDRGALAAVREKLRRNRASAPLFDTPRLVRHFEAAYREMWRIYAAGGAPQPITLRGAPSTTP